MQKETIQKTYQQLQKINLIDPEKFTDKKTLHPVKQLYKEILFSILKTPDEMAEEICQYIEADGLKKIKGFSSSIYRMLQTGQLNQPGLEKIIKTYKNHYQLD